jgi:hypothetical protein
MQARLCLFEQAAGRVSADGTFGRNLDMGVSAGKDRVEPIVVDRWLAKVDENS